MDITIVDNPKDREEMKRVMDGYADMVYGDISKKAWNDTEKYPRKQWLDFDEDEKAFPFTVVDNREGECFMAGFSTLDGAMLYICDCYTTCEDQDEWDYMGAVKDKGGLDEKGDNEYVIKCPIGIRNMQFVFGYAKKIVAGGATEEVFSEDIDEAVKFSRRKDAEKEALKLLPGSFDKIKNIVNVADEKAEKEGACT